MCLQPGTVSGTQQVLDKCKAHVLKAGLKMGPLDHQMPFPLEKMSSATYRYPKQPRVAASFITCQTHNRNSLHLSSFLVYKFFIDTYLFFTVTLWVGKSQNSPDFSDEEVKYHKKVLSWLRMKPKECVMKSLEFHMLIAFLPSSTWPYASGVLLASHWWVFSGKVWGR